ncbi:MAG: hypothetical protein ACO3SJ_04775, partial [Phycisphaerales bacterium]
DLESDRPWYRPGETVKLTLDANYTFGKPVAGAEVRIVAEEFIERFRQFGKVEGVTGEDGALTLRLPLKDAFVGQELNQGDAFARFTAEASAAGGEEHRTFFGLPSPGAAGAVASLIVLHQHLLHRPTAPEAELLFARASAAVIPAITLLVAFAMVSRLRYVHMTNRYLRGRHDFATLLKVVLPLAAAIWWPQITLAVGFTAYALSGPIRALRRRKPIDAAAAT